MQSRRITCKVRHCENYACAKFRVELGPGLGNIFSWALIFRSAILFRWSVSPCRWYGVETRLIFSTLHFGALLWISHTTFHFLVNPCGFQVGTSYYLALSWIPHRTLHYRLGTSRNFIDIIGHNWFFIQPKTELQQYLLMTVVFKTSIFLCQLSIKILMKTQWKQWQCNKYMYPEVETERGDLTDLATQSQNPCCLK